MLPSTPKTRALLFSLFSLTNTSWKPAVRPVTGTLAWIWLGDTKITSPDRTPPKVIVLPALNPAPWITTYESGAPLSGVNLFMITGSELWAKEYPASGTALNISPSHPKKMLNATNIAMHLDILLSRTLFTLTHLLIPSPPSLRGAPYPTSLRGNPKPAPHVIARRRRRRRRSNLIP